jgi:glycosyltransferase involved in cell wall biosynthesis
MFSYATGKVIESIYRYLNLEDKKVIAHFNEWMLGMGVLYLKDKVPSIATVFTTHATSIGRSICGNNKPLYDQFEHYDGDQMAKELNMVAKHSIEKQAAMNASCFTTVSRLTARECLQLLGKAPDVVTPNGFEFDFVPEAKAFDTKRKKARKKLIQVASCLCGEKIEKDALLLATGGRYEYKNKGIDVFIEAINRVEMENPERQIIAFILVPAWIDGPRADLQNRLQERTNQNSPLENPYYTHALKQPEQDKVCEYLRYLNFLNQSGNKTKIIFVPSYLNGNDGIFDLAYYDLLIGFDLTVFPSYYEPWGYTPLESIAFGIPTITTDLAGFGLWVKEEKTSETNLSDGVIVITRTDGNYFEVAEKIKNNIIAYSKFDAEQIRQAEFSAKELSQKASWSHFIKYYLETYDIALKTTK